MQFATQIPDGYVDHGYLRANLPAWPEVRIEFRPAPLEERAPIVNLAAEGKTVEYYDKAREYVAKRIHSWSLPFPATPDDIKQIRASLQQRIINVVLGLDAGDVDPGWNYDTRKLFEKEAEEAKLAKQPIGQLREDRDLKNSEAASS